MLIITCEVIINIIILGTLGCQGPCGFLCLTGYKQDMRGTKKC